jgi:transcriptional regulator with XRE-family HTH domain
MEQQSYMGEGSQTQKRKRGVILSSQGWQRLKVAEQQASERNNRGKSYTLEQLGEQTGLSPNTITKVRRRRLAVDRQTLEFYFSALNLTLNSDDYISVDGDTSAELHLQRPLRGQVPLDSNFYIERPPIDALGAEEVLQSGALIRIKGARQFGKTSLMMRILAAAEKKELHGIVINLRLADSSIFQNLNRFLRWFCAVATRSLQLPDKVDDYWGEVFGSSYSCTDYFESYLLPQLADPLVIALDELDIVFNYPTIATDFFAMLRAWYEKSRYGNGNSSIWQQLRLVVVHSTEVYVPLNVTQSPFNVGLLLELPCFTVSQVQTLSQRYGIEKDIAPQLVELLGGIPVLTQLALYHLTRREITLEQLMQSMTVSNGLFSSHLRYRLTCLQQQSDLKQALEQVILATEPVDLNPLQAFGLQSLGLVRLTNLKATPACRLYRDYFRQVLPNLP